VSGRRLRTLVRREVLATLRDPFTVGMLVAVPILALLLFGFVLSTEVRGLALGVLDGAQTSASRRFLAELATRERFRITPFTTRGALEGALVDGEVSVALVLPASFDREVRERGGGVAQVLYDGGEVVLAGNAEAFVEAIAAATAPELAGGEIRAPPAGGIRVRSTALFNADLDGVPYMVAGTYGFVLTFLTTLITAVSIVNERLTGTFEQLQVTPASSIEILLGKMLPLGAIFTLDVVLMVCVAGVVMGVWPAGSVVFFLLLSAGYVLLSLALGLLVSATSATAAEAVQKTVLLSVPLIMLSGFIFPVRSMPVAVQWLSSVFPATHYIRASRAIYLRGAGPLDLGLEIGVLAATAAVLLLLARRAIEARA
jgi:ABC-2 type transport system permease protein